MERKRLDPDYEHAYRNGESNAHADWHFWLYDVLNLPDEWSVTECKHVIERALKQRGIV